MKIRRHKHTKRIIKYYKANFGLDTKVFNVLIDGTFAHEALKCRINIAEQMPKFFDVAAPHHCKLFTTKCAVRETELLGKPTHGAMLILKQYQQIECKHGGGGGKNSEGGDEVYVNTEQCFRSVLARTHKSHSGHEMKFFIATQSESMKEIVRGLAGVPLMFISHSAINVERPSERSIKQSERSIESKLRPENEMAKLKKLKERMLTAGVDGGAAGRVVKKKKKKGGPNPLSCKKKSKKPFAKNS